MGDPSKYTATLDTTKAIRVTLKDLLNDTIPIPLNKAKVQIKEDTEDAEKNFFAFIAQNFYERQFKGDVKITEEVREQVFGTKAPATVAYHPEVLNEWKSFEVIDAFNKEKTQKLKEKFSSEAITKNKEKVEKA